MVLLMCHTHYTPTQPETLGLIDNTLPNKNLKRNVMDDILIDIQWQTGSVNSGPVSSLLTQQVEDNTRTQTLSGYT